MATGAVVSAVSNIASSALSARAAIAAAKKANQRNIANYQQRYQWSMRDMELAGLNPILAYQGIGGNIGGAPMAATPTPQLGNVGADTRMASGQFKSEQAVRSAMELKARRESGKAMWEGGLAEAHAKTVDALRPSLVAC